MLYTLVALLSLLWLSLFPASLVARGGEKTEVLPIQKSAPAAVVIETGGNEKELRTYLRAKNGVGELAAAKAMFSQAPTGSFGFIAPQPLGMALVTQSPDLVVERIASDSNAFEIHKLADGSGMLVGFIGSELVPQVTPSHRPHNIRLSLHSHPSEKAPYIAAVPLVKLMVDRMPVRLDAKKADSPVMMDMDLQGTANRKSPTTGQ